MLDFIVKALACYRLSRMVALESGPFELFSNFRNLVSRETLKSSNPDTYYWIREGIECPLCVSFWVGLSLSPKHPIKALALSGVASFLYLIERETL